MVLSGALDEQAAGEAAVELMTLDASGDEAVQLRLNCGDGSVDAALSLMDVIELLGVPVHVTCTGQVGGPAVGVLAVGDRRSASPSVRIRLFEPSATFAGAARELERWATLRQQQWEAFCERVAAAVGKPVEVVARRHRSGQVLQRGRGARLRAARRGPAPGGPDPSTARAPDRLRARG